MKKSLWCHSAIILASCALVKCLIKPIRRVLAIELSVHDLNVGDGFAFFL